MCDVGHFSFPIYDAGYTGYCKPMKTTITITNGLRAELNDAKAKDKQVINEAALKWVDSNVILIHEKMNRRAVQKLIDEISKFDTKFGPFKKKLPVIDAMLANAENGLTLVLTGKTSDKRAGEMLEQMSFIYNNLSTLFSKDIPLLLQTPILRAARENPEVRLDSINVPGFSPETVRTAFINAIIPSKEEDKLIRRILKSSKVPHIEAATIANELLGLSYNDLQELSNIEKVSMATTPEVPMTEEKTQSKKKGEIIAEALDLKKMQVLNQRISEILSSVKSYQGEMPETVKALNAASKAILKASAQGAGGDAMDKLKGVFGADTSSQVMNLYTMFFNFKTAWPNIKKSVENIISTDDPSIDNTVETQNDLQLIKKILIKAISPGLLKGSKAFSFISPDVFTQELINIITDDKSGGINIQALDNLAAKTSKFEAPQQVNPAPSGKNKESEGGTSTNGTTGSKTTTDNDPNAQTSSTQGNDAQKPGKATGITAQILKNIGRADDKNATNLINGVMTQLDRLGYDLVPRQK